MYFFVINFRLFKNLMEVFHFQDYIEFLFHTDKLKIHLDFAYYTIYKFYHLAYKKQTLKRQEVLSY